MKKASGEIKRLQEVAKSAGGSMNKLELEAKSLNTELKRLAPGTQEFVNKARQLGQVENSLRRIRQEAAQLGKVQTGGFLGLTSMSGIVPQLTAAGIAAMAVSRGLHELGRAAKFAFTAPLANARSFETSMARVATVMEGDSAEAVRKLGNEILDLSKTIPKSKEELGAGLYQIMQSGIEDAADAMTVLKVSSEAAIGGVTDMSTASKVLTDTINAYGLEASDAQELADIMFVGARMGTAEFEDLAGSLGTVNSSAALLGVTIHETVAATEAMALAGIDAQTATTSLNRLLLSVVDPSKEVRDAVQQIRKEFKDFEFSADSLKKKGLQTFMKDLSEVVGDNQELMVKLTGDVRAFRAASIIAGTGAENFRKILEATRDSEGALREAFIKNADTVDNLLVVAWNSFSASLTEAGQRQLPELKEKVKEITQVFDESSDEIIEAGEALSGALVEGIKVAVENAPNIIDALANIARVAGFAMRGVAGLANALYTISGARMAVGTLNAAADTWDVVTGGAAQGQWSQTHAVQEAALNQTFARFQQMRQAAAGDVGETSPTSPLPDLDLDEIFGGGGGGGGDAEADILKVVKDLLKEIADIEKDLVDTYGKQAAANKKHKEGLWENLKLKKEIGAITEKETRQLDTLNRRLGDGREKIDELKDAFEDAVDVVETAKDRVEELNDLIEKGGRDLADSLEKIDRETAKKKTEKLADLINEQKELNDQLVRGEGLSGKEQDRLKVIDEELRKAREGATYDQDRIDRLKAERKELEAFGAAYSLTLGQKDRMKEIDEQLGKLHGASDNSRLYQDALGLNKLDDLQKIDEEGEQRKREVVLEYNKSLQESVDDLTQANIDLYDAERKVESIKTDLMTAMGNYETKMADVYAATEEATTKHVANQVIELDKERAAVDALANSYSKVKDYLNAESNVSGTGTVNERASGGLSSGLTLVGERGPELLNLPTGSMVHSNRDSRRMLGGSVTISIGEVHVHNEADYKTFVNRITRDIQLQLQASS